MESVTKREIFNRLNLLKALLLFKPTGLIISLWLNDIKGKSEMGTLLIDANKEVSKYNNKCKQLHYQHIVQIKIFKVIINC